MKPVSVARAGRPAAAAAAVLALVVAGGAVALPQQQGSVDLINQADGQWQGPTEGAGSSTTGASVVGLGDLFRAGRSSLAIGAPEADPGGRDGAGSVYVVAGQRRVGTVDLTSPPRGYRIDGASGGDRLGAALAALRLRNGDAGLAIGAPGRSSRGREESGAVYVIDLRRLRGNLDLSSSGRPAALVAVIAGPSPCAQAGYALADAGPDRRAGPDDLLIGAPGTDPAGCPTVSSSGVAGGNRGTAFLLAGARLRGAIDLATTSAATRIVGAAHGDRAGAAVAGTAGVGGRVPAPILVGAPEASPAGRPSAGEAYVLRGLRPGRGAVSLAAPPARSNVVLGAAPGDALGAALSAGPGTESLALAAPQASPRGRRHAGTVSIIGTARRARTIDLASVASGASSISGAAAGDQAGSSLAALGDLNGDGTGDLAVGAPFANSRTGQGRIDDGAVYVVYGTRRRRRALDLAAFGSRGFVVRGARDGDEAGTAVAATPDPAGTGRPGLLIGAPFAQSTVAPAPGIGGAVYAVFGFGPRSRRRSAGAR